MGATCYSHQVAEALFAGGHGSTFGGNPLAASAGRATLETMKREDLPTKARQRGELLMDGLRQELSGRTVVREIRGRGLMVGIELREKVAPYLRRLMEEHQVLALPAGPTVLRLLPALVIEPDQIEEAIRAVAKVLS